MRSVLLPALFCAVTAAGCHRALPETSALPEHKNVTTLAFGSCSDQKRPQPLWDDILQQQPQVWIWLGDNIYGDSENMDTLKAKYTRQKSNADYGKLRSTASVIGIWDDHDYGVNDGGKEYPRRKESQQLMLDFLDVPALSPCADRKELTRYILMAAKDKK